jgi:hypothetical protein
LGKDGGAFQLGWYNDTLHLDDEVAWMPMMTTNDYKIQLEGISMNNITISDSNNYNVGFIDSGTTFTYLPKKLFKAIEDSFKTFCSISDSHCRGRAMKNNCFSYDEKEFPEGPLEYFQSFPILKFQIKSNTDTPYEYLWFPSEYFYRETLTKYCIAAETYYNSNEILMGGTFMRQHNFIFDVEHN